VGGIQGVHLGQVAGEGGVGVRDELALQRRTQRLVPGADDVGAGNRAPAVGSELARPGAQACGRVRGQQADRGVGDGGIDVCVEGVPDLLPVGRVRGGGIDPQPTGLRRVGHQGGGGQVALVFRQEQVVCCRIAVPLHRRRLGTRA